VCFFIVGIIYIKNSMNYGLHVTETDVMRK